MSFFDDIGGYVDDMPDEIVPINLADLVDDEHNDFRVQGEENIEIQNELLKDSIEQSGLLEPLIVRPMADGKYKVISGHRRKLICERLAAEGKEKFQQVNCIIKDVDDTNARQMLIEANISTRFLSNKEKLQAVEQMQSILTQREEAGENIPGRRRDHIAAVLGMSPSAVGRLENISKNLTDEYKSDFEQGKIGVSVADKIARKPIEKQKELHEQKGSAVGLKDLKEPPKPKAPEPEQTTLDAMQNSADVVQNERDVSQKLELKPEKLEPSHVHYARRQVKVLETVNSLLLGAIGKASREKSQTSYDAIEWLKVAIEKNQKEIQDYRETIRVYESA